MNLHGCTTSFSPCGGDVPGLYRAISHTLHLRRQSQTGLTPLDWLGFFSGSDTEIAYSRRKRVFSTTKKTQFALQIGGFRRFSVSERENRTGPSDGGCDEFARRHQI